MKLAEGLKAAQSRQGIHDPICQTADEDKADIAGVLEACVVNVRHRQRTESVEFRRSEKQTSRCTALVTE